MSELSRADHDAIRSMRDFEVLEDIEGRRLKLEKGVLLVTCGDGDRAYDIFTTEAQRVGEQCEQSDPRVHLLCWNGGAIRLAKKRHYRKRVIDPDGRATDRVYLDEIRDSLRLKNISTVALYAHAPCSKAKLCGLAVVQVLDLLFEGKRRIKLENKDSTVACFLHVDYGLCNGKPKKKTYFASRERFAKWIMMSAHFTRPTPYSTTL
jgi:hypothetical protein